MTHRLFLSSVLLKVVNAPGGRLSHLTISLFLLYCGKATDELASERGQLLQSGFCKRRIDHFFLTGIQFKLTSHWVNIPFLYT